MALTKEQILERDRVLAPLTVTTYKDLENLNLAGGMKQGYIFVSYKSDNWSKVFKEKVFELRKKGLRVYCDKNFDDTNRPWLEDMDTNLEYSSAFLMFLSREYLQSYATLIELLTAIKYKKQIIPVCFEDSSRLISSLRSDFSLIHRTVQMRQGEESRLNNILRSKKIQYADTMQDIYYEYSEKVKQGKLSVMDIVKIFEKIFDEIELKDNLFEKNIGSLINTIEDAAQRGENTNVFEAVTEDAPRIPDVPVKQKSVTEVPSPEEPSSEEPSVEEPSVEEPSSSQPNIPVKKAFSTTGNITYTLYGETYTENQSDMMLRFFAQVLKRHQQIVNELPSYKGMNCASLTDYSTAANVTEEMPSYFRVCRYFQYANGAAICIGTSYSASDKLKKMALLLQITGEDPSVFSSEQVELPVPRSKAEKGSSARNSGSSTDMSFRVFGKKYEANQTDMLGIIFSKMIEKHSDLLETIAEECTCVDVTDYSAVDKEDRPSYFRTSFHVYEVNGVKYTVGGGFSLKEKLRMIGKLIGICSESPDSIHIEGEELVIPSVRKPGKKNRPEKSFL